MASLPPVRRITKEDLRDAPDWITHLLYPLNTFMEAVYSALDANLTLGENVAGAISTLSFKTRSDYLTASPLEDGFETQTVTNPLKYKPRSVTVGQVIEKEKYTTITDPVNIHWDYLNNSIRIKYVSGLEASKKYEINLLVM